jgi:DUF4097 and DUF4098 domain-containing protein YvlB
MKRSTILMILFLLVGFLTLLPGEGEKTEVNKTFKAFGKVEIKAVSGDCIIKKGANGEIKVHLVYTFPKDKFEPVFIEEGNTLILKEEFKKNGHGVSGGSTWTVTVPEKTDIEFKAASGNFSAAGLKGNIHAKAASGDVEVEDLNGDLDVELASGDVKVENLNGNLDAKTASGDMKISNSKGALSLKCASGDIQASGIALTAESTFKSVSGDVSIVAGAEVQYDMEIETVSGNIDLDYNGKPVEGYFIFKGKKGDIDSDVPLESENESKYSPFVKKYFKKGGDSPKISMSTVSGNIKFKQ